MVKHYGMLSALYHCNCFTEKVCKEGLDVVFNYGYGWEPQGLGWDLIMRVLKNTIYRYTSSYVPLLAVLFLGGSKARDGYSTTKNTPLKFQPGSLCSFPPSTGPLILGSASAFSSFLVSAPTFSSFLVSAFTFCSSVGSVYDPDGL